MTFPYRVSAGALVRRAVWDGRRCDRSVLRPTQAITVSGTFYKGRPLGTQQVGSRPDLSVKRGHFCSWESRMGIVPCFRLLVLPTVKSPGHHHHRRRAAAVPCSGLSHRGGRLSHCPVPRGSPSCVAPRKTPTNVCGFVIQIQSRGSEHKNGDITGHAEASASRTF